MGLRNWTWRSIINGIIDEHLKVNNDNDSESEIDQKNIQLMWTCFVKLCGVDDLDRIPQLNDPEHVDVQAILIMYSLESFLFKRLNESSRLKDTSAIVTLGPFAVALTKIINNI